MIRHGLLIGVTLAVTAQATAQPAALRSVAPEAVDPIFAQWAADTSPGCAIAVDRDGRTVLARAWGMADLENGVRNSPNTVFEAGSVSKQFTAAAVLTLVEAGKLTLDTDVRTIIPELPDYGRVITIDQLLNHTSGLRDWGGIAGLGGWPRTTRAYDQADALAIIVRQKALNYAPGAESSYTNTGYNLLTEVVRRVSGKSLADYSQDVLFKPLGMTHSQWRDDFRRIVPGRAQAYDKAGGRYRQEMPFENTYGNGGLLTTVGDLLIWNRALDSGALGAFVTKKLSERSRLRDGRLLTYGRGLFNYRFHGTEEIAHAGSTAGYRAWLGRYPAYRLSIAMLCNASDADSGMGRKVAALFLPPYAEPPRTPKTLDGLFVDRASGIPLDLARYNANESRVVSADRIELTGRDGNIAVYLRTPPVSAGSVVATDYVGTYASDEVGATYGITARPGGGLTWTIRERPDDVRALAPVYRDAFQGDDGLVRFVRDGTGRVIALTVSIERARNVRFERRR
ncbi:serine hydrolase domain-containing protein [uncultured Sphingomonas sp.]|uniref:serine hydrolase domain-containing protein n=1 Tax=uncultured Sphingomonas sp. TaxID=158754 RepID=UPI00258E099D|nr:serine hydrolase domain-containing protein [uncultured Sphingomonas sp.]